MEIGVLSLKRKSVDASTDVFTVGPERAREAVRQRFQSELVAVRRLLQKARCEGPQAKRSKKASPSVTVIKAPKKKKMTLGEREMVAADLAGLAAQLPDDIVEFLEKQSCGIGGGEMEIDIHALQDEAMVELQEKLDMFARKKVNPSVQEHAKMTPEEEEEEDVDIVGGVSPLAIAPAPLQLAKEEEEDVDICGDASPVAMQKKHGDDESISGSPSSSSDSDSDSGSDSSGSGSDSSSSGDSESEEDESVDSPAPAERVGTPPITELIAHAKESLERQRKEARSKAREKARQEVLETERRAMPDETIHPTVLQSLRIVDQYNRPSPYNLLRRLGLFLRADNYGIQERHHHHHHHHRRIFQEDLEEGEIRV